MAPEIRGGRETRTKHFSDYCLNQMYSKQLTARRISSCQDWKVFKNCFFIEHLQTESSRLQMFFKIGALKVLQTSQESTCGDDALKRRYEMMKNDKTIQVKLDFPAVLKSKKRGTRGNWITVE